MLRFLCAMGIFGTIGLFVRWVDLPSSAIVLWRGIFGSIALYALMRLAGRQLNVEAIRKNGLRLLFTGVFLSANWIFLFEAYNRTSIATATLLYYMAPVLLILVSPLLLKERITPFKFVCVLFALLGMALVSGFPGASFDGNWDGVLCGILSAVFYTALILNNKFLKDLPDDDLVIAQLGVAALLTLPYVLATEDVTSFSLDLTGIAALLAIGILHTTIGCKLYFTSLTRLSAQRIAIFSYLDPVVAIFLSVVVLGEAMTLSPAVGAVLILGAALLSETVGRKPVEKESK